MVLKISNIGITSLTSLSPYISINSITDYYEIYLKSGFTINDLSVIYKSVAGKLNVEPGLISISWLTTLLALLFLVITAIFLKIYRIN